MQSSNCIHGHLIKAIFGFHRLHVASEAYHHSLSKKKDSIALDASEELLPIDALGVVMIHHGEQFGEDSAFGELEHLISIKSSTCLYSLKLQEHRW